jgi:hypothetical protein
MRIELEHAIRFYATACQSWYGGKAHNMALKKARELQACGDEEGFAVWQRLAMELEDRDEGTRRH